MSRYYGLLFFTFICYNVLLFCNVFNDNFLLATFLFIVCGCVCVCLVCVCLMIISWSKERESVCGYLEREREREREKELVSMWLFSRMRNGKIGDEKEVSRVGTEISQF